MKDGWYRVTLVNKNPPKGIGTTLEDWLEVRNGKVIVPVDYSELGFEFQSVDKTKYEAP